MFECYFCFFIDEYTYNGIKFNKVKKTISPEVNWHPASQLPREKYFQRESLLLFYLHVSMILELKPVSTIIIIIIVKFTKIIL